MSKLTRYVELVAAFVEGRIGPEEFSSTYFERLQNEQERFPADQYAVLGELFGDADAYEPDPTIRSDVPHTIDENQLRLSAAHALDKLRAFAADDK